jgi:beta-N-acetylhexosaminidase
MPRWIAIILLVALLAAGPTRPVAAAPPRQPPTQAGPVEAILQAMTPAERVGQLFVVSFYGPSAAIDTDIYNLITRYHIGGVILSAANDNITDTVQAPAQVLTLTNALQAAAVTASTLPRDGGDPTDGATPPYVPLLVAINHEGDGYPFTEVRSGLTALPSALAIGATWDPAQAEAVGRIAGAELSALGVNVLVGPSLDVLETPRPDGKDLGSRVFGGDPYWVGRMGQAYIAGVHAGSGDQVAVVAKHFPGHGGSDRGPEVELPTVRKSFEDLQSFDLVPFYAVTGNAPEATAAADALLTAHIRFQGFQGDIRQNTAPMSFDAQALGQLLGLAPIAAWRDNGGVTMSDSLGARAIKSFFDPTVLTFQHRSVARQAFIAGNDLLLLTDFGLNPRVEQNSPGGNVIDTLAYFTQNYQADQNFAERVDAAVRRILTLKLRLAGGAFSTQAATRPEAGPEQLGNGSAVVVRLAQAAAALISPTARELDARAPDAPAPNQRIVFFTDTREASQCSTCPRAPLLGRSQLEQEVVSLFGPNGSGQARPANLQSYSFAELAAYLENPLPLTVGEETPTPAPSPVEAALQQADWIVFGMLGVRADVPASGVVSTFLAQRPDLVQTKKVVVFAFNAPYYLDTTDLSKLTAYYALYSRTPEFVTVAARILYRDLEPHGAPPVSVASVGYNLIDQVRPDPAQIIELDCQQANVSAEGASPCASLRLNDTITVTIGTLLDHNGHIVPDQTPVTFSLLYTELGLRDTFVVQTVNGVAVIPLQLDRPGRLDITAGSDPAHVSTTIQINVQPEVEFGITPIVPTSAPSETPQPTATDPPPTATATATASPTATPIPTPPNPVDMRAFFVMCLGLIAVLLSGYRLGTLENPQSRLGVRVALAGTIGLLLGYNFVALSLPGTDVAYLWLGVFAAPVSALAGGILGLAVGWYWFVGRNSLAR